MSIDPVFWHTHLQIMGIQNGHDNINPKAIPNREEKDNKLNGKLAEINSRLIDIKNLEVASFWGSRTVSQIC